MGQTVDGSTSAGDGESSHARNSGSLRRLSQIELVDAMHTPATRDAACTEFVRRFAGPVLGFIAGLTTELDRDARLELVSEVMFKACDRIHQYRHVREGGLRAWCFTIARRVCLDYHRKAAKHPVLLSFEEVEQTLLGPSADEERDDLANPPLTLEQRQAIDAFRQLSDTEQLVIELRFVHDVSDRDIAARFSLQPDRVRKIRSDAMEKLRRHCEAKDLTLRPRAPRARSMKANAETPRTDVR